MAKKILLFYAKQTAGSLARGLKSFLSHSLNLGAMFYRLWVATFQSPVDMRLLLQELTNQVYFTAIQRLPIFLFSALLFGLLVIVHATQQLVKLQGEEYVGWLLVTMVVREIGPVWAAFYVLLRSGSAITAEVGTLAISREIEALKMMGIDPTRFLGVPRFWGLTCGLMTLYFLGMVSAILGGFLFARAFAEIFWDKFWISFSHALQWLDLALGFVKCMLFGMIIATVSFYFGLKPEKHLGEVAAYTSDALLTGLVLCVMADIVLTLAFYL